MITLVNHGVVYKDGKLSRAEKKSSDKTKTISYKILKKHNVSGNPDRLSLKFDEITSHDITYVGIIQTAKASGLLNFPIPYTLTNCHNSLCAVGFPPPRNTAVRTFRRTLRSYTSSCAKNGRSAAQ